MLACWDCRNLDGFSKVDGRGTSVEYRYDAAATADSAQRLEATGAVVPADFEDRIIQMEHAL